MTLEEMNNLEGRLGGSIEEGEKIRLSLIPLSQVVSRTKSLSVLAALALYNQHKK